MPGHFFDVFISGKTNQFWWVNAKRQQWGDFLETSSVIDVGVLNQSPMSRRQILKNTWNSWNNINVLEIII